FRGSSSASVAPPRAGRAAPGSACFRARSSRTYCLKSRRVSVRRAACIKSSRISSSWRARQLDEMREDLMQAARRTETLRLFKQYVRELRARKQAEPGAARPARGGATEAEEEPRN